MPTTCVSPSTAQVIKHHTGVTITATFRHCDDHYAYLDVQFSARNKGLRVCVQGLIKHHGQKGYKPVTGQVVFHDDGTVSKYGNTANGVRFPQKPFDERHAHAETMSVFFV